jgi:hypothetical protein
VLVGTRHVIDAAEDLAPLGPGDEASGSDQVLAGLSIQKGFDKGSCFTIAISTTQLTPQGIRISLEIERSHIPVSVVGSIIGSFLSPLIGKLTLNVPSSIFLGLFPPAFQFVAKIPS